MNAKYLNVKTAETLWEAELQYRYQDELNETYPSANICGGLYEAGDALRQVNPNLFRDKWYLWLKRTGWEEMYPDNET